MIREATDADAAAICELRHAWTEEDAGAPIDDDAFAAAFEEWWAVEGSHRRFWLAELDGGAVGMVSLVSMRRMPQPGRAPSAWGYVQHMYVRAEHRNDGVGGALLRTAIEAARTAGWWHLLLHPTQRAVPFYERHGFRPADFVHALPL